MNRVNLPRGRPVNENRNGKVKPGATPTDQAVRMNLLKFGAPLVADGKLVRDLLLEETLVAALIFSAPDVAIRNSNDPVCPSAVKPAS